MTLEEYKKELQQHDWFYQFSDDHGVWQRGERESTTLHYLAKEGTDDFKRAYNYAYGLRYNNSSFVTEKNPYTPPFPLVLA
jgi:hypothetical protein